MTVHIFGAIYSPSCANFALQRCAEDDKDQFSQEAVECLSVPTKEEAVSLHHEFVSICIKGGF